MAKLAELIFVEAIRSHYDEPLRIEQLARSCAWLASWRA